MTVRYFLSDTGAGTGRSTPWGRAQMSRKYARGITLYETAGHGGFKLSVAREAELDAKLREVGLTAEQARMGYEAGWYEEDCAAYAITFAWSELVGGDKDEALASLRRWVNYRDERVSAR